MTVSRLKVCGCFPDLSLEWLECQGSFGPTWDHFKLLCTESPDSIALSFSLFITPIFRVTSCPCPVSCFQNQSCVFSYNSLRRHRSQLCWSLLTELATSGHTVTAYLGGTRPTPFSEPAWCYHMLAQPGNSWTWVDGFAWCAQGDHVRLLPWLP